MDKEKFKCRKCSISIGEHNKHLHDGMCDDCFFETYFPKDQKAYLKRKNENISLLIEQLKKYDNEDGYNLPYNEVRQKLGSVIKNLIDKGENCVDYLHELIKAERTWSCLFALEILKEIKSEKSVPYLINFIKQNEDGDYWESCENAMYALTAIDKPAVEQLLNNVKKDFEEKKYFGFLVNSLTGIKDDIVYSFMVETVEDYLNNTEKYKEWFRIEDFTYHFDIQGKKDVTPLLRKIIETGQLSEHEERELQATIQIIEDPKGFDKEIKELAKNIKIFSKKEPKN